MSNFSLNSAMVRGDLFTIREGGGGGGKWKYTVQIDMTDLYDHWSIHEAVVAAFRKTPSEIRGVVDCSGYQLVVLDPYHKNSHPVIVVI